METAEKIITTTTTAEMTTASSTTAANVLHQNGATITNGMQQNGIGNGIQHSGSCITVYEVV